MKRSLLLLALVSVLPIAEAEAQRANGRAKKQKSDSTESALSAFGASAAMGAGLLSLFGGDEEYTSASDWCVGNCTTARRSSANLLSRVGPVFSSMSSTDELDGVSTPQGRGSIVSPLASRLGPDDLRALAASRSAERAAEASNARMSVAGGAAGGPSDQAAAARAKAPLERIATPEASSDDFFNATRGRTCVLGECIPGIPNAVVIELPNGSMDFVADQQALEAFNPNITAGQLPYVVNPEPGSVVLMLGGFGALLLFGRRVRKTS